MSHYFTQIGQYVPTCNRLNLMGRFNDEKMFDKFGYSVAIPFDGNCVGVSTQTNGDGGLANFFKSTGGLLL